MNSGLISYSDSNSAEIVVSFVKDSVLLLLKEKQFRSVTQ
jgi:hypothetical protein